MIHSEFRAQETGEHMRDSVTHQTSASRRANTNDEYKLSSYTDEAKKRVSYPFTNNTGKLLPSKYYSHVCEWYLLMMKPQDDMSYKDK